MNRQTFIRRSVLCAGVALFGATLHAPAMAQASYPNKPIKFVVPFAPGGESDIVTREVATKLNQRGYTIVVENKPGAGGNLGAEAAMREAADGYTFLVISGSYVTNAIVNKPNFDAMGAIQPVIQFTRTPGALVVGMSSDAKTLADYIAKAKKAPGTVTYGSAGVASIGNLSGEYFAALAGIKLNHVPYKGSSGVVSDVISGQVEMMMAGITALRPLVKSGKLRLLAVADTKRLADFPDVPTFAESGLPAFDFDLWHGLVAARGVPAAVVDKVNADINAVLKLPEFRQHMVQQGVTPVGGTPEQFSEVIRRDHERWQRVVKSMNLKAN